MNRFASKERLTFYKTWSSDSMEMEGKRRYFEKVVETVRIWRRSEYPCISLCMVILKFIGAWPNKSVPRNLGSLTRFFLPRLALLSSVYGVVLGHPLLAYESIGHDINLLVESISATILALLVCSILTSLLYRKEQLERLFHALEAMKMASLKLAEQPPKLLLSKRRILEFCSLFLIFTLAGVPLSLLSAPRMFKKRELVFYHWYPFDARASPAYELVFTYTFAAHVIAMSTITTYHMMLMTLFIEASGQFRLLGHNLRMIRGDPSNVGTSLVGHESPGGNFDFIDNMKAKIRKRQESLNGIRDRTATCIRLHYAILRFVKEIDATFNQYLFLFMTVTLVPSGMCILLMFYEDDNGSRTLQYIFMITGSNLGTGIVCWLGNDISVQSEEVREAIFDSDWFDLSESFKRSMCIIISRCNQPVVVNVGGFVALSMETYYGMTKLTYSYIMATWRFFEKSAEH